MKEFKGKVALITGAGNGFGREFAKEAASRGMKLFLVDIDAEDLAKTGEIIEQTGGVVKTFQADCSLESDVDAAVQAAMKAYNQIDLLINNAGIAFSGTVEELPPRDWRWIVSINGLSQVYFMHRVIPIMRAQGTPCHILNVASAAGLMVMPNMPAYHASKHFSVAMTESTYYDLQNEGANIKMSVFCPGFVQTDLYRCERHRPTQYQAPDDPYYSSAAYYKHLSEAEHDIKTGTPLEPVAPFVFQQLEQEKFYIILHPSVKIAVRHRNRDILRGRVPNAAYIRDLLQLSQGKASFRQIMNLILHF